MEEHDVGGAARDRVHGERHRAGDLPVALEAGREPRVHAERLGEPVRRHDRDAVDRRLAAGRREERAGGEAVDVGDRQAGVRDRGAGGVDRDRAERPVGVAHDRALRVPGDRDAVPGGEAWTHDGSNANAGTIDVRRELDRR